MFYFVFSKYCANTYFSPVIWELNKRLPGKISGNFENLRGSKDKR